MTDHASRLLSVFHPSADDDNCLPDEFYEFCSQFIYQQGSFEDKVDVPSLMLLLWQMHRRIDELEGQ